MPSLANRPKGDSFTFRLAPGMKATLTEATVAENKRPAELIRSLLEAHLARGRRLAFEEEARRHYRLLNDGGQHREDDEGAVMRELGEHLDADDFSGAWTA